MNDRRQARILAMQALCQLEVLGEAFLPDLPPFLADESPPKRVQEHARQLVEQTWAELARVDEVIQASAENWVVSRMAPVDRNILRVAVCELLNRPEVPPKVALDEAVEIGKTFGTAESGAFINGVLDAVLKKLPAREAGVIAEPGVRSESPSVQSPNVQIV